MKKLRQSSEYISIVNFLAVLIAIASLSVLTTAFAVMLKPEKFNEIFRLLLTYAVLSFTISYLILKPIDYLFLSKLPIKFMWLLLITLGSFGFSYSFANFYVKTISADFTFFFGFLLLALLPSAIFRYIINFAISYWQERKQMPVSIVK